MLRGRLRQQGERGQRLRPAAVARVGGDVPLGELAALEAQRHLPMSRASMAAPARSGRRGASRRVPRPPPRARPCGRRPATPASPGPGRPPSDQRLQVPRGRSSRSPRASCRSSSRGASSIIRPNPVVEMLGRGVAGHRLGDAGVAVHDQHVRDGPGMCRRSPMAIMWSRPSVSAIEMRSASESRSERSRIGRATSMLSCARRRTVSGGAFGTSASRSANSARA